MSDHDPLTKGDFRQHEKADTAQFAEMHRKFDEFPSIIQEAIKLAIKETVNGKIDRLTKELQGHMGRTEPMIIKFEEGKAVNSYFSGKKELVINASSVITALGVIIGALWLIIGYIQKLH